MNQPPREPPPRQPTPREPAPREPAPRARAPGQARASDRARYYAFETIGCQMNVYDSERMEDALGRHGYRSTDDKAIADLILINTCSVREKAEHKVASALGKLKVLKEHNPELVLAVAGCVAQQEGEGLLRRVPHLDLVLGPDQLTRLPELVAEIRDTRVRRTETATVHRKRYSFVRPTPPRDGRVTSFVTVMKGCNKFCSFCIVPATRGREVSKPSGEVLDEVRMLVDAGVREVTLLGQNVNSYGRDRRGEELSFPELLRRVGAVAGLERLRFTTSHPMDCSPELIAAFGELRALMPWFHLPVQAGSERVLKMMRRSHGVEDYREMVAGLRAARPDIALSSDIIVGFPGETEADFEQTMALVEDLRFSTLYSFIYSPRPGTAAARIEDDVPLGAKKARLQRLQARQQEITDGWMASFAGAEIEVLFEGPSTMHRRGRAARGAARRPVTAPPQLMGRTPHNVKVNVESPDGRGLLQWPGRLGRVKIERVGRHSLSGRLLRLL